MDSRPRAKVKIKELKNKVGFEGEEAEAMLKRPGGGQAPIQRSW